MQPKCIIIPIHAFDLDFCNEVVIAVRAITKRTDCQLKKEINRMDAVISISFPLSLVL